MTVKLGPGSKATDLVGNVLDENGDWDLFSSNRHVATADTALRYTAPAGGPNRIPYAISDGKGGTDRATVTVSDAAYEAFLLDPAVSFFIALADAGQAVPDETDETNNDLNFLGLYHRPASPSPLLIRGGDDTDRRADESADTIELTTGGADTIRADGVASALLHAEGGTGSDTLVFLGGGIVCDLTGGVLPRVRGMELLDIGGSGVNRLVLRQGQVLEADGGVLHVRAGADDAVDFGSGWTLAAPQFINNECFNVLTQAAATLRLTGPHPWQNPVNVFDVNNNGAIAPEDVLAVINLINLKNAGPLTVPPTAVDDPPNWYDVPGDDNLTPADVLAVINWINGHAAAALAGMGEGEQRPADEGTSPAFLKSRASDAASDVLPTFDTIVPFRTLPDRSPLPARTRRLDFRDAEPSVAAWHEVWDLVWGEWFEEVAEHA